MTQQNVHALRNSALKKLNAREAAALLGPFVTPEQSSGATSTKPPKFLGPNGEEWTDVEWLLYVSRKLGVGSENDLRGLIEQMLIDGVYSVGPEQ